MMIASEYLTTIGNVPRPRPARVPTPRRPRYPRTALPVGTRVGELWTIASEYRHQPGRERKWNAWIVDVTCPSGHVSTYPHHTLVHQVPKVCQGCKRGEEVPG